ncbi:hypothetical protein ACVTMO_16810 [Pseudomonas segetis]
MDREEAFDHIARIAAEHALIAKGFGGLITIVHPQAQRQFGIEDRCLYMAGQGEFPGVSPVADTKYKHTEASASAVIGD